MKIGELSRQADVPTKTIRYYEQIGLLPPPARTASGYRDYHGEAADRLGFVKAAQSVGLSLGEIREILSFRDRGEVPCRHVVALIERHARDISERITALEQMRGQLEALAERARTIAPQPGTFCHIIEAAADNVPASRAGRRSAGSTPRNPGLDASRLRG